MEILDSNTLDEKNKTPSWDSGFSIEQATLNKEIRKGLAKEVAFELT